MANKPLAAGFKSALRTRKERNGTWTLTTDLIFYSAEAKKTIRVPRGFNTDFASVPRLPFVFLMTGDTAHEAAVIHDYLYRSDDSTKASRKIADEVFNEAMGVLGIAAWRKHIMWLGVRAFGNNSYKVVAPVDESAKAAPEVKPPESD